ncbi:MAG: DUF1674 domain-containing protein [Rhodospirillales bacterium]
MADNNPEKAPEPKAQAQTLADEKTDPPAAREIGGVEGPDPTRYGDWEKKGRCIDF